MSAAVWDNDDVFVLERLAGFVGRHVSNGQSLEELVGLSRAMVGEAPADLAGTLKLAVQVLKGEAGDRAQKEKVASALVKAAKAGTGTAPGPQILNRQVGSVGEGEWIQVRGGGGGGGAWGRPPPVAPLAMRAGGPPTQTNPTPVS